MRDIFVKIFLTAGLTIYTLIIPHSVQGGKVGLNENLDGNRESSVISKHNGNAVKRAGANSRDVPLLASEENTLQTGQAETDDFTTSPLFKAKKVPSQESQTPIKQAQNPDATPTTGAAPQKKLEMWQEPVTGMKFVKIPGGCFQMGQNTTEERYLKRDAAVSNFDTYFADEQPQHKVCVDEFWMGIYEVTQGEWQKIMEFNPSVFQEGDNYPVEMVSWDDTQLFLSKLNELDKTSEFRLPSEAEWEYAARAGTTTIYNTGDSIKSTDANFNGSFPFGLNLRDEYRKTTMPVGSFHANAFGLYDMHGNVWEWCNDWYESKYYQLGKIQNPAGPESGQMKVLRGGSWFRYSALIRSATRYKNKRSGQYADTGFRVVKSPLRINNDSDSPMSFDKDF